jgi:uncharacterized membrane protein
MMEYLALKAVHILSAILLFGTGLGSAFYKFFTDRGGVVAAMAETNRLVVRADWWFTTPTILIQPVTGYAMMQSVQWSWDTPWLLASVAFYLLAGACWLPVVWLQIRMLDLSRKAAERDRPVPDLYWRMAHAWFLLGIPAFAAMVLTVLLMVFKPAF